MLPLLGWIGTDVSKQIFLLQLGSAVSVEPRSVSQRTRDLKMIMGCITCARCTTPSWPSASPPQKSRNVGAGKHKIVEMSKL